MALFLIRVHAHGFYFASHSSNKDGADTAQNASKAVATSNQHFFQGRQCISCTYFFPILGSSLTILVLHFAVKRALANFTVNHLSLDVPIENSRLPISWTSLERSITREHLKGEGLKNVLMQSGTPHWDYPLCCSRTWKCCTPL